MMGLVSTHFYNSKNSRYIYAILLSEARSEETSDMSARFLTTPRTVINTIRAKCGKVYWLFV